MQYVFILLQLHVNHSQSKKNSGVSQIYDAVYETCLLFCPILNNVEYSTYSGVNPDYKLSQKSL